MGSIPSRKDRPAAGWRDPIPSVVEQKRGGTTGGQRTGTAAASTAASCAGNFEVHLNKSEASGLSNNDNGSLFVPNMEVGVKLLQKTK